MLLVYPGNCTDSCQHSLYNLRQLRLATGSDMNRIERAILTYNNQTNHTLSQLLALPFQGTKEIRVNRLKFESIIKKEIPASATAILPGTIYLVDPHGNIMMFYAPPADPKGMFKDLQRLLKVSQIG